MEDMRKAAVAYYERAPANQQELAKHFFSQIDRNRNGKISQKEFMEAIKHLGYGERTKNELSNLFEKLDTNFDRELDFYEALAFYHLVRQHRTLSLCDGCSVLITGGVYFSCLECHLNAGSSYDLCVNCHQKCKFDQHMHKLSVYDNNHLIQIYRKLVANLKEANKKDGGSPGSSGGLRPLPDDIDKEKTDLFCSGCSVQLAGIYFSCFECRDIHDSSTYDLCIDCYRKGNSDDHLHYSLYDNYVLLQGYRKVYEMLVANGQNGNATGSLLETVPKTTRTRGTTIEDERAGEYASNVAHFASGLIDLANICCTM